MNREKTLIALDRTLVKKCGLRKFIELSWHQIEPGKEFIPGWHIDAISEHLEAITKGHLTRLIINIPPGCMKSLTACVFWPAWVEGVPSKQKEYLGRVSEAHRSDRESPNQSCSWDSC